MVAERSRLGEVEPIRDVRSPYSVSAATSAAPPPEGVMQRDLVERARRGDHDAFAVLAGAAISRLDATAWLMLRDADRAKDAVQNALVRAWRDLPTLRDPDRFDAWLHRLLVNACIDEVATAPPASASTSTSPISSDPPSVADSTSAIADRDQLERGFSRLEPDERAVIVLHHYLDLPLTEVAATLGIPLGTAKSRLYRGLRADASGARRRRIGPDPTLREGQPGMTTQRRLRPRPSRTGSTQDAEHRVPRRTSTRSCAGPDRTRQRPAWSSLERWLPMQYDTPPRARSPRVAWLLVVLGLIVA